MGFAVGQRSPELSWVYTSLTNVIYTCTKGIAQIWGKKLTFTSTYILEQYEGVNLNLQAHPKTTAS